MVNYTFSLVNFEYFLLVLVRIATFVFAAPFFSLPNVPRRTKVGFSCLVAIIVVSVLHPTEAISYTSVFGYAILVLKEAITGLILGFCANICSYIITFSGDIMDMDVGISMASEFDPSLNTTVTLNGQLYFYLLNMMIIVSGMYRYIIRAVIDSFRVIPLGASNIGDEKLVNLMVKFMADFFGIAFRIVLPVFGCIMIMNCVLGVMAKVAPQMNMFSVGVQIKILVGFGIIFLTTFLLPEATDFILREMKTMLKETLNIMSSAGS